MRSRINLIAGAWLMFGSVFAGIASAQDASKLPAIYEGVGIDERLGEFASLDVSFQDEEGREVVLADFVDGRPVILNFVYHTCPMLCSILLDQLVEGLSGTDRLPGKDFRIITVSMASFETPDLARRQKEKYLSLLDRPGAEEGWHFLTGSEESISTLAASVGFGFKWVDESSEFAHPAALIFLSDEGKITRYLHGMHYPSGDVDMAITEASVGSVATVLDRVILYCYRYDPTSNSYVVHAGNLMKLGGILTLTALGFLLFVLWRRESQGSPAVAVGN